MLLLLFWPQRPLTRKEEWLLNITIITIPMLFTLFYPHIGTILGYVGAFTGFAIMYLLPVMVHLKRMKTRITNPLLAEAIDMNAFLTSNKAQFSTPKIQLDNKFLHRRKTKVTEMETTRAQDMNRYYLQCFLHSFIPVFGALIVFFQFYKF